MEIVKYAYRHYKLAEDLFLHNYHFIIRYDANT